jgi:threonyl-tRNA synthetase
MPDCHAFCTDLEQAKKEFITRFKLCTQILEEIGLSKQEYEAAIRFTKDFYEENKPFINSLAKIFDKPVLVEMWSEPFFYFRLKWDFNFVDNQNKAAALSTDQIDFENAKRYDIKYVDEKGEKRFPLILHCSPSGAIERCIYALLERAYKEQQSGKPPMLPTWLSPTQIRMIPMSEKHHEYVGELADKIEKRCIRVDIDERPLTLQKRIREAEMEWVPYAVVVGQQEVESGMLPVRDRKTGKIIKMKLEELINEVEKSIRDKPFMPLPLPKQLSRRPQFYG